MQLELWPAPHTWVLTSAPANRGISLLPSIIKQAKGKVAQGGRRWLRCSQCGDIVERRFTSQVKRGVRVCNQCLERLIPATKVLQSSDRHTKTKLRKSEALQRQQRHFTRETRRKDWGILNRCKKSTSPRSPYKMYIEVCIFCRYSIFLNISKGLQPSFPKLGSATWRNRWTLVCSPIFRNFKVRTTCWLCSGRDNATGLQKPCIIIPCNNGTKFYYHTNEYLRWLVFKSLLRKSTVFIMETFLNNLVTH